ncbi:MAG TPA: flavodoxin family protein [Thermoleophilia bacterium]|nr:flavodoxin family protein [Thermoleophilia bacterium]HQG03246.1 flavodoxin family protein [Thermoleophilia bacterium]HQG54276.1 flavodoxin family protein [Thermoleophilia bacterium]HQJ97266.1 flavodoxin family protein [Thermoleophilia bacterium]
MKVVAFNGSARKDGNTALLVRHVFAELEAAGIETELVQLAGKRFSGCTGCLKCARTKDNRCSGVKDDGVNACIARMLAADGIVIASPTYYANCSATTQALMERAGYATRRNGNPLARKVGAAVVAARRAGAIHAFDSINHWFQINEMIVVGSRYWNVGMGEEPGEVEHDDEGVETMRTLGRNMAWVLERLYG